MLFNSFEFIFLLLPFTVLIFFLISRKGHYHVAAGFLVVASLFYYGWWNPSYLGIIISSILFNYGVGKQLAKYAQQHNKAKKLALFFGVAVNVALLGYYKYTNFFVDNLGYLLGDQFNFKQIILPLAISFFTFQQIAYLVDAYHGELKKHGFLHYCLFVTFFPQLIAGPIVQHKEMLPQFTSKAMYVLKSRNLAIGISIFAIGLFKKVVIADNMAIYANPVFAAVGQGSMLHFLEAWGGALAYTLQLYFDFSGYIDMAIGIATIFGVRLPINFNSPYKAVNISEFWQRWHITLGRFLRNYLYIPLGGNRKGFARTQVNIMIVMLLSGLWHGAGWNFVVWGGLHGIAMVVNTCWRAFREKVLGQDLKRQSVFGSNVARLITLLFIIFSWVFFRAETLKSGWEMVKSMLGLHGIVIATKFGVFANWLAATFSRVSLTSGHDWMGTFGPSKGLMWIFILFCMTRIMPNTKQIFTPGRFYSWKPNILWLIFIVFILQYSIVTLIDVHVVEFIYFNF